LVDVEAERAKLDKQLKELDGWIKGAQARLANEKFVANAPAQVVADVKSKLDEMLDKQTRIRELLASLQ
jgi:valyl-tRNA synthetase